jgi:hypothetical protein
MTTLADINESLINQTQVLGAKQSYTSGRVDDLIKSFDKAFKPKFSGDDLEDRYESRGGVATTEPGDNNGGKGRFFDFDVGNLLPFAATFLGGLLKRGLLVTLGMMLADEIGDAVTKLTGSEVLGNVAEWATMGGAIGFLFGAKFGLMGAVIGAIFSEASREKIAKILSDITGEEFKKSDKGTFIAAGAASAVALFMPKILAMLVPKLVGFLLSPAGLLVAVTAATLGLAIGYFTDDEFRAEVDKQLNPLRKMVDKFRDDMIESTKNFLDKLFDNLITTSDEDKKIDNQMSQKDLAKQQIITSEIDQISEQYENLGKARQTQLSDIAPGNQSLKRVALFAQEQGIDLSQKNSKGVALSSIDDTNMLVFEIRKILLNRKKELEEKLKPIQAIRDDIEVEINKKEEINELSTSSIEKQLKNLSSLKEAIGKSNPGKFASSSNSSQIAKINDEIDVLKKELNSRVSSGPSINAVDNSVTNNGESNTTIVGKGSSTFDANDPKIANMLLLSGL